MTDPLSRRIVAALLARRAVGLPEMLRRKTRLHIADSIGIALAARSGLPIGTQVIAAMGAGCGTGNGTVIGGGQDGRSGLAPPHAAFVNAALIHALDFDDIHDVARLHPTTVTLPAAMAAADLAGAPADAVAEAVCLGNELMCRLGVLLSPTGSGPGADWLLTQVFGYSGATLAAGLVLDLDADAIVAALGLAYMQAAGGKETAYGVGATARSIYPAFAAMGGVHAALLARAGIVGPASAFDGPAGLFKLYFGGDPDPARAAWLCDGDDWAWEATEVKPWPSCRLSHPYIAAALALRPQLQGRRIDRIVVAVNASAGKLCRPLESRRRPETLQDAKYSVPFMTAFALAHGKVDLSNLGAEAFKDQAARTLVKRLEIQDRLPDNPGHPPAEITVEAAGQVYCSPKPVRVDVPEEAVRRKFLSCLSHAGAGAGAEEHWALLTSRGTWRLAV